MAHEINAYECKYVFYLSLSKGWIAMMEKKKECLLEKIITMPAEQHRASVSAQEHESAMQVREITKAFSTPKQFKQAMHGGDLTLDYKKCFTLITGSENTIKNMRKNTE
ncbi:MAG: hypothetical protein GKR92_05315 [Gammaproteobacteria bacterium]|nr:MAG: hypothetical protein GKR92_05315 [Gammaproteobacteria bacterium]